MLDAAFEKHVEHELLGSIPVGTLSTEYYWLDRWYNVFRFRDPEGGLKTFYCNINMPPEFNRATLTYVDLDIDILVEPDFSYRILDWDDFAENVRRYSYPPELQTQARNAVAELVQLIETRSYPFNV